MANSTPNTTKSRIAAAMETSKGSVYTIAELVQNHKAFGASYEIVSVALRLAGKSTYTSAEAQTIIDKFRTKEVK